MDNCIAIVGIGLRLPGNCSNPQEFWENLLKSFDGVIEVPPERWSKSYYETKSISVKKCGLIPLDEWKNFDPLFFGISPKDSHFLDPQERMMLMVTYEALEDAQIPSNSLRGSNTGVFVGVSVADYGRGMLQKDSAIDYTPSVLTDVYHNCMIANRVSYCFDLRGPSMSVDTACSSSLVSVDLAIQYIENGTCDVAIACGVNALLDPMTTSGYTSLGVISDECLSFDSKAKGFARSEGCGVVVLKRLSDAQRDGNRIYSVIRGRSSNNDGSFGKDTMSTPSSYSQSVNIEKALNNSSVSASDIYYVETHATGTVVGDPIEVESLSKLFTKNHSNDNPLKIGSVKSNIGHLESAAGITSLIKVALMLKNKKLVPTIKIKQLNPKIPFDNYNIQVVTQIEDLPNDRSILMGVNSFGVGGANCHAILEEYKNPNLPIEYKELKGKLMIPISGNSKQSMEKYLNLILNNDNIQSKIDFNEFALHQSFSKSHLSNRMMVLASDWNEFNSLKYQINQQQSLTLHKETNGNKLIFVFCGQGPQWNNMGLELYQSEPIYRNIVDDLDSKLMKYTGYSIINKIKELPNPSIDIHKPIYAQPFLFIFQVAIFELFKYYGIQPSIVLGHSFGDITASYCSGNISLDTAIKIVHFRSILQNETIGSGKMLVVGMNSQDYIQSFSNIFNELEIACYNSPQSIVISGPENQLQLLVQKLNTMNIFNTFLRTPCSFHSKSQESIKSKVFSNLSDIESNQSSILWYSTVIGDIKSDGINSEYIYNNIRDSVQFEKTIESIEKDLGNQIDDHIFIEISPHPTLSNLIKQCIPSSQVVSPFQRNRDGIIDFISCLSNLYCLGVNINFKSQFNDSMIKDIQWKENTSILPRYQWDLDQYWFESSISEFNRLIGPSTSILGNRKLEYGSICYHSDIDIKRPPFQYLSEHRVKNLPILCGTSYIDAIIEAFKSFNQDIQINSVDFNQALYLKDQPQRIQTLIDKVNNSNYKVQFYIKDSQSYDSKVEWIKSTEARVSLIKKPYEMKVDISELKNQCKLTTMKKQEFYKSTNRVGISYGPSFQHIQSLMIGENCVFGTLKTKTTHNTPTHLLTPTLLDSCIHSLLGIIYDRNQVIFKSIENFKINSKLVKEIESNITSFNELYCYSKLLDKSNIYNHHGKCYLFTSNGDVILEIEKFTVSIIERIKMKSIKYPNEIYNVILQTKDTNFHSPKLFKLLPLIEISKNILSLQCTLGNIIGNLYDSLMKNLPNFNIDLIFKHSSDELVKIWNISPKKTTIKFFNRIINILKENHQYINEDRLSNSDIQDFEFSLFIKAVNIIPKVLLGDEEIALTLFEDGLIDTFYQESIFCQYSCKQITNLVGSLISDIVSTQNQKRIIKILEIGGGTGSLTHPLISILDDILKDQDNIEVYYTFTDISQYFLNLMKDKYENQINLKSNLKIKYQLLDIEKDFIDQRFNYGCYDIVLMSSVLHIASNIQNTLDNIHKVMTPSGWLLFSETTKFFLNDLIFGNFSTIWSFEDSIREDHYSLTPQQWCDILSESNGFHNVSVTGLVDENGNPLPPDIGSLFLVRSQKLSIDSIIKNTDDNPLIIIDKDQNIDDISKNNSMITIDNLFEKSNIIKDFKNILFIPGTQQLSIDNYQRITYDLCCLFKIFINQANGILPNISIVTRDSENSNYFANSLLGIVRSTISDYKELKVSFIDIDTDLQNHHIQTIINLSNNQLKLGDYEFFIKNNQIYIPKVVHIEKNLFNNSSSIIRDRNQLGCKLNMDLEYKLFERLTDLKPNEFEIEVKAVGLNFKDYFRYIQGDSIEYQAGDKFHPPYGWECSGIISRIGNDANDFKIGDEIIAIADHTLSSHVISSVDKYICIKKPKNISFIEAASITTIFLTVYYSLFEINSFDPENDLILIHSAAGGVGLAALEILKWKNAKKVYVSASSQNKFDYLKSNYSDLILDYFDSTTTEFSSQIKNKLNGVDYIINTLALEYLESNFKCLAPFGKLIDLVTTNASNNDNFDFRCVENDVQYIPVNLILVVNSRPKLIKQILSKLLDEISIGNLKLPKMNIYDCLETKKAVLSFKDRNHIGKKVIDFSNMNENILQRLISINTLKPICNPNFKIDSISNSIVIVGQKGISLELIPWFLKHCNVSDIIVLSYSSLSCRLERLIGLSNNKIHFYQCDISNYQQLEETFKSIIPLYPPIEHIFNLALILEDIPVNDITLENIQKVHNPKVIGTYNLHLITQSFNLSIKQFIVFSSVISLYGGLQPSYASASLVIESICEYRNKVLGLPSKSIRLGAISSEGTVAESTSIRQYLTSLGIINLEISKFFGGFETFLQQSIYGNPILLDLNINSIYKIRIFSSKIEHLTTNYSKNSKIEIDQNEKSNSIKEYISKAVSVSLDKLDPSTKLKDIGVDSLVSIQIKEYFDTNYERDLFKINEIPSLTIKTILSTIKNYKK